MKHFSASCVFLYCLLFELWQRPPIFFVIENIMAALTFYNNFWLPLIQDIRLRDEANQGTVTKTFKRVLELQSHLSYRIRFSLRVGIVLLLFPVIVFRRT